MSLPGLIGFERKYAVLNGVKYSYLYSTPHNKDTTKHHPSTLLFVHGFPDSAYGWRHQLRHFAQHYTIIAPDMLGYNETETPANLERFSAKHISDDLKALLTVEKVDKAVVIGHDWGGYIAWRFANYHGDLLQYLIVLCTFYWPPADTPFPPWETYVQQNPNFNYMTYLISPQSIPELNARRRAVLSSVFRRASDPPSFLFTFDSKTKQFNIDVSKAVELPQTLQTPEEVAVVYQQIERQGFAGPTNWYRTSAINSDDEIKLKPPKEIHSKVLFIAATNDEALPPTTENLAPIHQYAVGGVEVKYVESGHFVQLEKDKEVNEIIEGWLNKQHQDSATK